MPKWDISTRRSFGWATWSRKWTGSDYEYDFGDGWEHTLVVEARETAQDGEVYPACVAGEGACPPEDCGGSPGFAEFKAALAGPPGTERDALLQWAGGDYDPGRFNLSAVNAAVSAI